MEGLCHKIMGDSPNDEATDPAAAAACAEQVRAPNPNWVRVRVGLWLV